MNRISILIIITVLISGCFLADNPASPPGEKPELQNGIMPYTQYGQVAEKLTDIVMSNGGAEIFLDLADDEEYGFLMERLTYSRKNRSNSPALFASIERTRTMLKEKRENSRLVPGERVAVPEGIGHFIIQLLINAQKEILATAHGSVWDDLKDDMEYSLHVY